MTILANHHKLLKIGVFYDGSFFTEVSNFYKFHHPRGSRLSFQGLHNFISAMVAQLEETTTSSCRVIDAHFFRGRFPVDELDSGNRLRAERAFEYVMIRAGVVAHFLPRAASGVEKGIDVWLALEAFELAFYKRFSVLVLLAGDGDYLPLIRKLHTLGTRVMLLGWDFEYTDNRGNHRRTRTAQTLYDEAFYAIQMNLEIDDRARRNDPLIDNLFV